MSEKEKYSLMIWCGALHDIGEKEISYYAKKQINDVRQQIEKLVIKSRTHNLKQ